MAAHPAAGYPKVFDGRAFRTRAELAAHIAAPFGRKPDAARCMLHHYRDDAAAVILRWLGKEVRHGGGRCRNRHQFHWYVADKYGVGVTRVQGWWQRQPSPAAVLERAARHAGEIT